MESWKSRRDMIRGLGKADGAGQAKDYKGRGFASKGDRGKLQETMSKDYPVGRGKACR